MEPAKSIVEHLGGAVLVARALDLSVGAISKWSTPIERGGRGGLVPSRHIPKLCKLALARGGFLEPNSFFRGHI